MREFYFEHKKGNKPLPVIVGTTASPVISSKTKDKR
jgi:hypothetical protein